MSVLVTSTPVITARKKASKNVETSETREIDENDENSNNRDKDENLETNFA